MKKYLVSIAIIPLLLLTYGEAKSTSVGDLFAWCTSKDRTINNMCGVYMAGFMNGVTFEQLTRGNGPTKICMPDGIDGNRVKQLFEGFMREYPKLQTEAGLDQPGLAVGMALLRAYPCAGVMK